MAPTVSNRSLKATVALAAAALGLATAAAEPADIRKNTVDSSRIDRDFAAASSSKAADGALRLKFLPPEGSAAEKGAGDGSPAPQRNVPLLLAPPMISELNSTAEKSGENVPTVTSTFVPNPNGYDASRDYGRYQMLIKAMTSEVAAPSDQNTKSAATGFDYPVELSDTETGRQATFGYAGAHFVVDFQCVAPSPSCVTNAEIQRLLSSLVLCRYSGDCVQNAMQVMGAGQPATPAAPK